MLGDMRGTDSESPSTCPHIVPRKSSASDSKRMVSGGDHWWMENPTWHVHALLSLIERGNSRSDTSGCVTVFRIAAGLGGSSAWCGTRHKHSEIDRRFGPARELAFRALVDRLPLAH